MQSGAGARVARKMLRTAASDDESSGLLGLERQFAFKQLEADEVLASSARPPQPIVSMRKYVCTRSCAYWRDAGASMLVLPSMALLVTMSARLPMCATIYGAWRSRCAMTTS